jgi:hypothetical protein
MSHSSYYQHQNEKKLETHGFHYLKEKCSDGEIVSSIFRCTYDFAYRTINLNDL